MIGMASSWSTSDPHDATVAWETAARAACIDHDASTPHAPPLPRGVVSVVDTFGADPTGTNDATEAFQMAVTAARTDNVTLFVPFGCYT